MKNDIESSHGPEFLCSSEVVEQTVIYNPAVRHWYLDTHVSAPFLMDYYPTKRGKIDPKSLTKTMVVTQYYGINIGHFTSYDVLFLKDSRGKIGIFTMVDGSGQDFGNFFRTDHKGFGYKKAHLYMNKRAYHQPGAQHYLTTEDLNGKWALLCLYHPQDFIDGGYNEFISRYCLAKDFNSEKAMLDYFKNELNAADLLDPDRFVYIDPR